MVKQTGKNCSLKKVGTHTRCSIPKCTILTDISHDYPARESEKTILISRITLYFRKFSKEFVGFSYLTFAFQLEL